MMQKDKTRVDARRGRFRWGVATALCLCACALSGCGIGPVTMERDRLDYQTALSESWKRQILLNLVRLRYAEAPVFLEVTSIISQYTAETQLNAATTLHNPHWWREDVFGASGTISDRPTVTYMPMAGEKFARSLFTPIPPATIVALVQSGWPVDTVFRLTCSSINGIRNRTSGPIMGRAGDPQFEELLEVLRRLQLDDTIAARVEKKNNREQAVVILGRNVSPQVGSDGARGREMLGLDPNAKEFRLVYGALASDKTELAMLTRSMSHLLMELSACVEVPPEHVAGGKTYQASDDKKAVSFIRIHSGAGKPSNAFATVSYRGYWYWVDDGDLNSKRMLSLIMMFFSLVETGGASGAPIVTVQAG
jgi:hypothetical protein